MKERSGARIRRGSREPKQEGSGSTPAEAGVKDKLAIKAMLTRNREIAKEIAQLERERSEIANALKVLKR